MLILPAIDLYEKKAVRLHKGDYAQMTVYRRGSPGRRRGLSAAAGAEWLHVVDLEGARDGTTPNAGVDRLRSSPKDRPAGGGGRRHPQLWTPPPKYLDAGASAG